MCDWMRVAVSVAMPDDHGQMGKPWEGVVLVALCSLSDINVIKQDHKADTLGFREERRISRKLVLHDLQQCSEIAALIADPAKSVLE